MIELSLFSGGGGGVWASKLLGWRTAAYVECDAKAQRILRGRQADGAFDPAPIYGDIRSFISAGFFRAYRGKIDVVSGGFPCQPFSPAGKHLGERDPRNMWPATIRTVRAIGPAWCFFENAATLLGSPYWPTIVSDLETAGYLVHAEVLAASDMGAPHIRKRLWITAYAYREHIRLLEQRDKEASRLKAKPGINGAHGLVADSAGGRLRRHGDGPEAESRRGREALAYSGSKRRESKRRESKRERNHHHGEEPSGDESHGRGARVGDWWESESGICRVVDGMADRSVRLRALGNGQVPIVAAVSWTRGRRAIEEFLENEDRH